MQSLKQPAVAPASSLPNAAEFPFTRKRELIELIVMYACIVLALWTSGGTQKIFIGIALLWVGYCTLRSGQGVHEWGLGASGFLESLWVVLTALLLAGLLVIVAVWLHTLHIVVRGYSPLVSFTSYALWALLQEFILLNLFLHRLQRILPSRGAAVVATALLFAIAHIPNPVLFVATLFWGALASVLFLRYRNIYTLALAHAVIGLTLAITVPDAVQHQMRVGIGYFHWHAPVNTALSKPQ